MLPFMLFYLRNCPKFTTFLLNGFPFARFFSIRNHILLTLSTHHCCRICVYLHKFFPREEKTFPSGRNKKRPPASNERKEEKTEQKLSEKGTQLKEQIAELRELLYAYRHGIIKENKAG